MNLVRTQQAAAAGSRQQTAGSRQRATGSSGGGGLRGSETLVSLPLAAGSIYITIIEIHPL